MKVYIALILVVLSIGANSQVLGIDFGTEFWKAALISPGKNLVIVENSRSERKTLNAVLALLYRSPSTRVSGFSRRTHTPSASRSPT